MEKLAIIGSGIAGLGAAHHLKDHFQISIFEQNNYVGGHTNTISVAEDDREVLMDTGFMVFNYVTYPNLCRLFKETMTPVKKTDMSFSVQHIDSALEYCGSGLNGLFAQRKNLLSIAHYKLLLEIARFNKESPEVLDSDKFKDLTIADYFKKKKISPVMLEKYLIPMSSAVWSTPMDKMLDFPISTLVRFFNNHGFLGLTTQHQWYTIEGGSKNYRDLLIASFRGKIYCNRVVTSVTTTDDKIQLGFNDGTEQQFDKVIIATHADQALRMLSSPTELQHQLLSAFKYQPNLAVVHSDESVMPASKRAWSSWNYVVKGKDASTIYWMNKLQGVSDRKNYFVSINPLENSIDEKKVHRSIQYEHPLFDIGAIKAQERLDHLNREGKIFFCGSYFKYGFHEDAYTSGLELSKILIRNKQSNADNYLHQTA